MASGLGFRVRVRWFHAYFKDFKFVPSMFVSLGFGSQILSIPCFRESNPRGFLGVFLASINKLGFFCNVSIRKDVL